MARHRVVIIGGGFGGLSAAKALRRARDVQITLIDRRNFHLFQPLLYQVATGGLSPANIAAPLRALLKRQRNVQTLLGQVETIDGAASEVVLKNGERLPYDTLILAVGARHHYFGKDEQWEPLAPGLKTVEDATEIRRRVLSAFEAAEQHAAASGENAPLTFVVVGGGPTGVEMAGALGELSHYTLRGEFRSANPASARVLLVEGEPRLLGPYPEHLSHKAAAALEKLGVEIRTHTRVTHIEPGSVTLERAHAPAGDTTPPEKVTTHCVIWAAGVRAASLASRIAKALKVEADRAGRLLVENDCSLPGHPQIFAIGDMVQFQQDGQPLPGVAQVAMQQGKYVANLIRRRLLGQTSQPFHYKDLGQMATIGRGAAVAKIGRFEFNGYFAWLTWLFVHLMQLVGFQNRVLVLLQWAWNYFTRNRSARLITKTPNADPNAKAPANN